MHARCRGLIQPCPVLLLLQHSYVGNSTGDVVGKTPRVQYSVQHLDDTASVSSAGDERCVHGMQYCVCDERLDG